MRKQGGILEIKLTPSEIATDSPLISLELNSGSYLKLEISDTGHGIDHVHMNRIFDPFFTTKGLSEGTGLGLSIVYGIVKNHNGAITVDSVPGSGSTFTVYLPALQHQETKEEIETEVIRSGNESILFVDDEPMIAALGSEMLRKSGYKVTDLTDSLQALEMFTEHPDAYDLVITDMTMPRMTGIDLAKYIWAIRPDTPVILCTGHSNMIDEEQAKKEGIRRFIMKPLRYKELLKAVSDVLDEYKQPV
jgi:CheY-like chemotaxis protein